jgi:MoxR-like ATPase
MGEHQVTVGQTTYKLERPFLVMATQNPIEQEGTYPLPEAQLDRFLMHISIGYPAADSEKKILALAKEQARQLTDSVPVPDIVLKKEHIRQAQIEVLDLHVADAVEDYMVQLVMASRNPQPYGEDLSRWVNFGASPRGTIALDRCARAHAWLLQRDYVSPEDVQAVVHNVLRHRVLLSFEAEAEGISSDDFISELIKRVPVS